MENNKISIIIPVYNKEKYIKQSIESVLNQTYKNLEIIIIDDGSTDNSREICRDISKRDSRINMISTENRGAGSARNLGLANAHGDFISFVDADDYLDSEFYEKLLNLIIDYDADIAECKFQRITRVEEMEKSLDIEINVYDKWEKLLQLYGKDDKLYVNTVIMCNKIFKKDLFSDGIKYPTDRLIDDEFIIYKLIDKSNKIVSTSEALYGYVQSAGSVMRQDFVAKRVLDTIDVYDEVYKYFELKPMPELIYLILLRYIKYCVELKNKAENSNMTNKKEVIEYIEKKFTEKWEIIKKMYEKLTEFNYVYDEFYKKNND